MIALTEATVRLGETVADKEQAIRRAAGLLVENGHIAPEYADSMLGREKVANTYLGSGIAIPHGLLKDRDLIRSTGLAVLQVPDGVEWNPGETVQLVVAIAAASDEHLQILANLTQVLADESEIAELVKTTDPAVVVRRLTRAGDERQRPSSPRSTSTATPPPMWCCASPLGCTPVRRPPSSMSPRASRATCVSAVAPRWPTARASPPC